MYKVLITFLAASLGLTEWANVAAAELFSKTGPVIAIMSNDLFLGEAEGHLTHALLPRYPRLLLTAYKSCATRL